MIVVKVELWPLGFEHGKRELGRMYVANDGKQSSQDPALGDYTAAVCRKGTSDIPKTFLSTGPTAVREGRVVGHRRLSKSVWSLVLKAIASAFPEEKL